jgi:hypothetical protein
MVAAAIPDGPSPSRRVAAAGRAVVVDVKPDRMCEEPEVDKFVRHARERVLKIPAGWARTSDLTDAFDRLHALHPA